MIIPKEQRLGYEYRIYHHYAAIILVLGTVGKILVTASILDLSNFKFQEFIMMSYRRCPNHKINPTVRLYGWILGVNP